MSRSWTRNASAMPASRAQRLVVAGHQRLAAGIGARHHQHEILRLGEPARPGGPPGRLVEQQVLQRRVGQHRAEPGEARRDAGELARRRRGACAAARSAARRDSSSARSPASTSAQRAQRRDVGHHHGERLLLARLALAQPRDRRRVARIAGEMEAAQALDRDDLAAREARERRGDRVDAGDRRAVAHRRSASRGPHAGQALGSAWKRRSRGDAYSARHAGHCANAAMLVIARS